MWSFPERLSTDPKAPPVLRTDYRENRSAGCGARPSRVPIDFGMRLLAETGVAPLRKVIDVSGDGPNSSGRPVVLARDEAASLGVTINGLPIMLKRPSGFGDMEDLDLYYRDCVSPGKEHSSCRCANVRNSPTRSEPRSCVKSPVPRRVTLVKPAQATSSAMCSARGNSGWDQWRN